MSERTPLLDVAQENRVEEEEEEAWNGKIPLSQTRHVPERVTACAEHVVRVLTDAGVRMDRVHVVINDDMVVLAWTRLHHEIRIFQDDHEGLVVDATVCSRDAVGDWQTTHIDDTASASSDMDTRIGAIVRFVQQGIDSEH